MVVANLVAANWVEASHWPVEGMHWLGAVVLEVYRWLAEHWQGLWAGALGDWKGLAASHEVVQLHSVGRLTSSCWGQVMLSQAVGGVMTGRVDLLKILVIQWTLADLVGMQSPQMAQGLIIERAGLLKLLVVVERPAAIVGVLSPQVAEGLLSQGAGLLQSLVVERLMTQLVGVSQSQLVAGLMTEGLELMQQMMNLTQLKGLVLR